MNAHAQFSNALYYEGLKAKLLAAETEADAIECVHDIDCEAFERLPENAQTELLALYARLVLKSGAGAP